MSKVLITGGAGYIGSHISLALAGLGDDVTVLDNLSTGHAGAVYPPARLAQGDIRDSAMLDELFAKERFESLIHCAGSIVVSESVADPLLYYGNNLGGLIEILKAMVKYGVRNILFSSSAAVYGHPDKVPISEDTPAAPINPYGRTKLMSEQIIRDACDAHGMRALCLRYFNVAGADAEGRTGQNTPEATHLIKVACQAALGKRASLQIYGDDYDTPDGTCVRDYIHVTDLADIHALGLEKLIAGEVSGIFNCGYGRGFSVKQVVETVKAVSGVDFPVQTAERRKGDPPALVADTARFRQAFGWTPKFNDLETIVESALNWERSIS